MTRWKTARWMCSSAVCGSVVSKSSYSEPMVITTRESRSAWNGPARKTTVSPRLIVRLESATIAANGFRFRVPYGTLLCVSDKPLHGELKLPGMATAFYKRQVAQHLQIGIRAMESLREMPLEKLHSRKLRSFDETAFL